MIRKRKCTQTNIFCYSMFAVCIVSRCWHDVFHQTDSCHCQWNLFSPISPSLSADYIPILVLSHTSPELDQGKVKILKVSKLDMFFICLLGGLYQNCDACTWSKQTRHRQLEHQQDYSWFIKHTVLIPSKSNWLYLQGPLWDGQNNPNTADFIR